MSKFDEVGERVFRRRYDSLDLNVGLVAGAHGLVVVDTRVSHLEADELRFELSTFTSAPVVAVVNTHYHWDHVWGNARFPEAPIWGHVRCREELVERGEQMKAHILASVDEGRREEIKAVNVKPPTEVFEQRASIDLGDRTVLLDFLGRGHTDSDIVVTVPDADVTFAGDLVEEGAPPAFGDSFPTDWPDTLLRLESMMGRIVVPGHGDVVDAAFVAGQRAELAAVASALAGSDGPETPLGPYPPEVMAQAYARYRATRARPS